MNGSVYFHILINFGTCFSKLISWKKRCSTKVDHKTCYKILVKQGSGFVIVNSYKKYMYFQIRFKRDVKLLMSKHLVNITDLLKKSLTMNIFDIVMLFFSRFPYIYDTAMMLVSCHRVQSIPSSYLLIINKSTFY